MRFFSVCLIILSLQLSGGNITKIRRIICLFCNFSKNQGNPLSCQYILIIFKFQLLYLFVNDILGDIQKSDYRTSKGLFKVFFNLLGEGF